MKHSTFLLLLLIFMTQITPSANALTTTPTPDVKTDTATPSSIINQIEKIKEMVASRVAELKLVEKRGLLGTVSETGNIQLKLENYFDLTNNIDIDELTKFEDATNKSFGISDIKKGDVISAIGLYNKDTKRLLARIVTPVKSIPTQLEGAVVQVDIPNFQLTITDEEGKSKKVDVERSTKTSSYSTGELAKSGFSKIKVGERVLITGYYDLNDKNVIISSRIIHFTDIPASANMQIPQNGASTITETKISPTNQPAR